MFKLSMIMCSAVMANCYPEVFDKGTFDTYYECAIKGYETSVLVLNDLGKELTEQKQIYIKFTCLRYELI
tara:strand:+ start:152 stop:361 length:210 start_codon:yes stop_codon:yes gene_type:complete